MENNLPIQWPEVKASQRALLLEIAPSAEPIVHTTFSCVGEGSEEDILAISEAWVEHAKYMCNEGFEHTQDKRFLRLAESYLALGQAVFFQFLGELYAANGFPVYDGLDFFEVYSPSDLESILSCQ